MVKIIIKGIILSLILNVNAFSSTGYGDLKLSYNSVENLIKYLDSNSVHNHTLGADQKGTPSFFSVTSNGEISGYSYCPRGYSCRPSPAVALRSCKDRGGNNCKVFARGRKIVWNKVNYRISRKATRQEIIKILEDLGFYGENVAIKENPKITKKKENLKKENKENIVSQLKSLKDLYNSGDLSKEQYEKAKKKLLD